VRKELALTALTWFCQQLLLESSDKKPEVARYTYAARTPRDGLPAVIRDVADVCRVFFLDIPKRHWRLVVKREQRGMDSMIKFFVLDGLLR